MIESTVRAFAERHALFEGAERVVLGVSGGVDSVVLARLLAAWPLELRIGHVHHGLRGEEADRDARFVREIGERIEVPVRVVEVEIPEASEGEGSPEELARSRRYEALGALAEAWGASHVAVGHHRDDQIETVLLQLFRGTGLEGLAGMAPKRLLDRDEPDGPLLVRPLLGVRRSEIEAHARDRGWAWRTDSSNRERRFRRNALRHEVLPRIAEIFGEEAPEQVARTSDLVRAYLEAEVLPTLEDELERWTSRSDGVWVLELADFRSRSAVWRRHLILTVLERGFPEAPRSEATARAIDDLVEAQVGRRVECGSCVIWRERGRLYFEERDSEEIRSPSEVRPEHESPPDRALRPDSAVSVPGGGRLSASAVEERVGPVTKGGGASPWTEADLGETESTETGSGGASAAAGGRVARTERLDADRLEWPLRVRPWQAGDRVQPLGMEGTRLVSDLLTDRKIPPHERGRVAVLVSGGEIVWVLGVQLAHPARIREATERIVTVRYEP